MSACSNSITPQGDGNRRRDGHRQFRRRFKFHIDPVVPSLKYLEERFLLEFTAKTLAYPE
ncbi:MAG: hypothetical protein HC800_15870 [Phormidesmis sp. RL_2_1]|nr:hypothetical protein [Phormidesmis sp. RL_2_1]